MKFFIFVSVLAFATLSQAGTTFKGFVKVRNGLELYVDTVEAAAGQPTVVLLNGLTYSTEPWERYASALIAKGVGVVRYDMQGMGKTLLKYAPATKPFSYKDQVQDLKDLMRTLQVAPPYNLVGLSYGGAIAVAFAEQFPQDVGQLILMAPFTEPLAAQDKWIKMQVANNRLWFPQNPATDDELYDFFLKQIIYATYPSAEPSVLDNPYKLEAVYRLVQGVRKFLANTLGSVIPPLNVHLVIAGSDQYIDRSVLMKFWRKVPNTDQQSIGIILGSEHKIPEAVPHFLADYTNEILQRNPVFSQARALTANPKTGLVTYKGGQLQLTKEP